MGAIALLIFSIILIAGPIMANASGLNMGVLASTMLMGSGIVLAILSGTILIITRLYQKTKASEAFVRTGMGGMKVIQDGGAIVIPVVHQAVSISLKTIRLQVSREAADALITKDKLRADVQAEFFVRVMPDEESVKAAARSFGEHMDDAEYVKKLVEDKLISALRTVAATKTLEELNIERDKFVEQVTQIVTPDLKHNGLTLEVATISKLDQTDPKNLRDDNIFDAQGKRTIAETTQQQLTARNALERNGEQARKQKDVETRQAMLALELQQAEAEASQGAEIAKFRAEQDRQSKEAQVVSQRQVDLAVVDKSRQIEVAQRAQQQAVEVAERQKIVAIKKAEQDVEVAERKKQEAVAMAETERALAQSRLAEAEAHRERQQQAIKTVMVEAEAEREKTQQVIGAQAEAERKYVQFQRAADAEAYGVQKKAEGQKAAADAEAEAITKKANAEASASQARAIGQEAEAMVPVRVANAQVDVEQRRVEVLQKELEAREHHGAAAQEFEITKLRVTKEAEVRIAGAQASAQLFGHIQATVYGTPEDVTRMAASYMNGMGISRTVNGFFDGASPQTLETSQGVLDHLKTLLETTANHMANNK